MKLEELLGAELYAQVKAKIDEVNAGQEDKVKHIRYADLSEGGYVGKGKYDALQVKFDSLEKELTSANDLITQLKADSKGNEEIQGKISGYETQVENLQNQLAESKLNSAIKIALLEANAGDVDYLTFKLNESMKEKGKSLELDESDHIKGWDEKLKGLQTKFPKMFGEGGTGKEGAYKPYEPKGLPKGGEDKTITKEQFKAMTYEERVKLKKENEKLYQQLKD